MTIFHQKCYSTFVLIDVKNFKTNYHYLINIKLWFQLLDTFYLYGETHLTHDMRDILKLFRINCFWEPFEFLKIILKNRNMTSILKLAQLKP